MPEPSPHPHPTESQPTWHVQSPVVQAFIAHVVPIAAEEPDRARAVQRLRPVFGRLLSDKTWLPPEFTVPDPSGGMAEGIGNYLIYRSASLDLSLMSLVVAPGISTPVHDHLAWGLVGLYQGEQDELVFRRRDSGDTDGVADLELAERRRLREGEFYELLPPDGDIHQVRTVGPVCSVSLHLLGSDIGCVWRNAYDPEHNAIRDFRSGYSNEDCPT